VLPAIPDNTVGLANLFRGVRDPLAHQ
jgi:hypothetical protein